MLNAIHQDDFVFVRLSKRFVDLPRLQRLTQHSDSETRSIALVSLWSLTHDLEDCLPRYLKAQCIELPLETQIRAYGVNAEIKKLKAKVALLPPVAPEVAKLEEQIQQLNEHPAMKQQVFWNLGVLGRATATQKMATDQPVECGIILARLVADSRESLKVRVLATGIITSIAMADNSDRKRLVDAGILKIIETGLDTY